MDLEFLTKMLTQIFTSSPPIFLCVALIALGYGIKLIPAIPNKIIPLVIYLVATVAYPLISVSNPGSLPQHWPVVAGIVRDVMGGIIIASISWMIHALVLKKFIDSHMPVNEAGDTKILVKPIEVKEDPKP